MYIVLNGDKAYDAKTLKALNKQLDTNLKQEEFQKYKTGHYLLKMTDDDLDYVKDLSKMDSIFISNLFKKDKTQIFTMLLIGLVIIINLIVLVNIAGLSSMFTELINTLNTYMASSGGIIC